MTRLSSDFQSILGKYEKHKADSYKVAELLGEDYTFRNYGADDLKRYVSLVECGTFLQFGKDMQGVYHLTGANFCRQRVCPMCQFRKAERTFAETLQVVKTLESEGFRFLHLVLTVPNPTYEYELQTAVKILYRGFNRFLKYKQVERAFKGALRCLEVSYNYNELSFHPHLHCLIVVRKSYFNDCKVYLPYDLLRELWTKAVRAELKKWGSEADFARTKHLLQISVRACKAGDYVGVAEVCKYCVKPLEFNNGSEEQQKRLLLSLISTLKGTRFLQKYGIIKDKFRDFYREDNELEFDSDSDNAGSFVWNPDTFKYEGVKD